MKHILFMTIWLCIVSCSSSETSSHTMTVMEKVESMKNKEFSDYILTTYSPEDLVQGVTMGNTCPPFFTTSRVGEMNSPDCSLCHTVSLVELQNEKKSKAKNAHWDIALSHAKEFGMDCMSCHDAEDITRLKTAHGRFVNFDRSYLSCASCHQGQYKDWLYGAHGKRKGGWAARPRVLTNCVECHNPHDPTFAKRFPVVLRMDMMKSTNTE